MGTQFNSLEVDDTDFLRFFTGCETMTQTFLGANIGRITLPPNLKTIKTKALVATFDLLIVPASVTSMDKAFDGNNMPSGFGPVSKWYTGTMLVYPTTPPPLVYTIMTTKTNMRIYVPDGSVSAYKSASVWSTYASYIHPMSDYEG